MATRGVDPALINQLITSGRARIMAGGPRQLRLPQLPAQAKPGRAKGVHKAGVMNKTEAAYARLLDAGKQAGTITDYWFEGMKLQLAEKTTITVDFLVELANGDIECHEVKPRINERKFFAHEDAWIKLKIAADKYRCFRFVVVWPARFGGWNTRVVPGKESKK